MSHNSFESSDPTVEETPTTPTSPPASESADETVVMDRHGKIIIYFDGGVMMPKSKIRNACTLSFQAFPDKNSITWKEIEHSPSLNVYWGEFQKRFSWDETITAVVYKAWKSCARVAFADHMYKTKKLYREGTKADWIKDDIEASWTQKWQDPKYVARCESSSRNRRSEPAGPGTGMARHYGGSRNALVHANQVAKDRGISVQDAAYDTFLRMHLKDGRYTDGRSQQIDEAVKRRCAILQESGEEITPAEASRIYREVASMDPKGRVFGMGVMSQTMRSSASGSSQSSVSSAPTEEVIQLRARVDQQEEALSTQQEELATLKRQMAILMQKLGGNSGDGSGSA